MPNPRCQRSFWARIKLSVNKNAWAFNCGLTPGEVDQFDVAWHKLFYCRIPSRSILSGIHLSEFNFQRSSSFSFVAVWCWTPWRENGSYSRTKAFILQAFFWKKLNFFINHWFFNTSKTHFLTPLPNLATNCVTFLTQKQAKTTKMAPKKEKNNASKSKNHRKTRRQTWTKHWF